MRVTSAFGVHEKLAELILGRAGLPVARALTRRGGHALLALVAVGHGVRRRLPLSSGERVRRRTAPEAATR